MKIAFFGSSLVSAYWNGAATYYRGLVRALAERGHDVTFYEPDAYGRQQHRDIDDPPWARVVVYSVDGRAGVHAALEEAERADLVVKASGVGIFDELLEEAVAQLRAPSRLVAFWDVDAPATLARMRDRTGDPLRALVPRYDLVFTYGGGPPVVEAYERLGARACIPVYNAHDPDTHHPVEPDARFAGDLGFLGNRMPDREARVHDLFFGAAARLPDRSLLLGGNGWDDVAMPPNVRALGHVYTRDHNAFNCSLGAVLNISRDSMARTGYSPATRVFEAAAAGACVITDAWAGIDRFFEPGREILVARDADEVAEHVRTLAPERRRAIGEAARARVCRDHTYADRAAQLEQVLGHTRLRGRVQPAATPAEPNRVHTDGRVAAQGHVRSAVRRPKRIVIAGLSVSSSWGNGHATTYRGLIRELARAGHDVLFLERDVPWYAQRRDAPAPEGCRLSLYGSLQELFSRHRDDVRDADAVIVGSYVPHGVPVIDWVQRTARGVTAFYDIDTPVTLAKLARGDHEYLEPEQVARFDVYLSFAGGPTLEHLEKVFGAQRARALYCSVDAERHRPLDVEPRWDLGYLGTYSPDRQPTVERLLNTPARRLPDSRFVVAGPSYPSDLDWPANVERIDHVPPHRHPPFYGAQRFALNVTRADMIRMGWSPSVRIFEAAACGVPIISDRWEGLEELLAPGEEVLLADDAEQVVDWVAHMSESERRLIGLRARDRVLASHTAAHRAQELIGHLEEAEGHGGARERSLAHEVPLQPVSPGAMATFQRRP